MIIANPHSTMSYLYLCFLIVQYLKIVNSYDHILYVLLVMRISIVTLHLHHCDYIVYIKKKTFAE